MNSECYPIVVSGATVGLIRTRRPPPMKPDRADCYLSISTDQLPIERRDGDVDVDEFKPVHLEDFLNGDDLDYLISLIKEPFPATMNFYKMLHTIGNTYGELFPVIQEERPDVMEKLMGMVNQMDEIEENARKAGFSNR